MEFINRVSHSLFFFPGSMARKLRRLTVSVLLATGLRSRSSLGSVIVNIGGTRTDALYAGAQGSFVGLDQLNVLLPRSLAGRGEVDLSVTVDGQEANKLRVVIK